MVNRLTSRTIIHSMHITQIVRNVKMLEGVTIYESKAQKDELILEGTDVQNVSQSGKHLLPEATRSSHLTPGQLPLSTAFAGYETRISGNSWMVSTSPRRVPYLRSKLVVSFLLFIAI